MKTLIKVLCWVLVVALLAGGIAVILAFTNGGNEEFKTFYLEKNGEKILTSETTEAFSVGNPVTYKVHYTFGAVTEGKEKYVVKVYPNEEEDFDFRAGETFLSWRRIGELTALEGSPFSVVKEDSGFTFTAGRNGITDVRGVLAWLYPNEEIVLPEGFNKTKPFFVLFVANYNESVVYRIRFSLTETLSASELRLDKDHIVF